MPVMNTPNQVTPMVLERARSFALRMSFVLVDDKVVDLTGGTITFTMLQPVRKGTAVVLTKDAVLVSPDVGYAVLDLQAAELDLDPGTYPYSITYVDADAYSATVVKGEVTIVGNTDPLTANVYDALALDVQLGFDNVVVTVNHLQAPTLQIGTVETIAYGNPAGAGIRGGYPHQLLDLKIPRGAPGGTEAAYNEAFTAAVAAANMHADAGDNTLQANIDATNLNLLGETNDRTAADTALQASINATQAELDAYETTTDNALASIIGTMATDAELSAAIAGIPPSDTVYLSDKNLINNPGFELLDNTNQPNGWSRFWKINSPIESVETTLANVYEGAYCAKTELDQDDTSRYGTNLFAVGGGEILTIRFRVKTTAVAKMEASIVLMTSDPAGNPDFFGSGVTQQTYTAYPKAADGWVKVERAFAIPPTHTKGRIYFQLSNPAANAQGTITVWLDKTQAVPESNPSGLAAGIRDVIGKILEWPGFTAPDTYLMCDGAAYARATYPTLWDTLTWQFTCVAGAATAQKVIPMTDTSKAKVGMVVDGVGLGAGNAIVSIVANTSITVTNNLTAAIPANTVLRLAPWGNGDGSTTFNVPDKRGRTGFGVDGSAEFDRLGRTGGMKDHTHLGVDHLHAGVDHLHTVLHNHGNTGGFSYPTGVGYAGGANQGTSRGAMDGHFHSVGGASVTYTGAADRSLTTGAADRNLTTSGANNGTTALNPYAAMNYIIKAA